MDQGGRGLPPLGLQPGPIRGAGGEAPGPDGGRHEAEGLPPGPGASPVPRGGRLTERRGHPPPVLLGEEIRPPTGRRLFSDEELLRFAGRGLEREELATWREETWDRAEPWLVDPPLRLRDAEDAAWARLHGLDTLCREALHLELMDHQIAMALCALASRRALCLAGRQSGKDYTQAALALWEALVRPGARIIIVSGSQRQVAGLRRPEDKTGEGHNSRAEPPQDAPGAAIPRVPPYPVGGHDYPPPGRRE